MNEFSEHVITEHIYSLVSLDVYKTFMYFDKFFVVS